MHVQPVFINLYFLQFTITVLCQSTSAYIVCPYKQRNKRIGKLGIYRLVSAEQCLKSRCQYKRGPVRDVQFSLIPVNLGAFIPYP